MTDELQQLAGLLIGIADEIEAFSNNRSEDLSYEDYDGLQETEVALRAYACMATTTDPATILLNAKAFAENHLEYLQERLSKPAS